MKSDLITYYMKKWNKLSNDIKIKRYRNSFERFLCEQPLDDLINKDK